MTVGRDHEVQRARDFEDSHTDADGFVAAYSDLDADEKATMALQRQRLSDQRADKREALRDLKSERRYQEIAQKESTRAYEPMVAQAMKDSNLGPELRNELHRRSADRLRKLGFGQDNKPTDEQVAESLELVAGRLMRERAKPGKPRTKPNPASPATGNRRGAPGKTGAAAITTGKDATEEQVLEDMRKAGML